MSETTVRSHIGRITATLGLRCPGSRPHRRRDGAAGIAMVKRRCGRRVLIGLVSAFLWLGGGAAEAQDLDVFGGGGMVLEDAQHAAGNVGASVWVARNLSVGGRLESAGGGVLGLLSVHYRIRLGDDSELLVGSSPVYYGWGAGGVAPIFDVFAGRRVSSRLGVRFGMSALVADGAFIHLLGQVVYSLD